MQKKELLALKRINATPLMVKLAKENKLEKPLIYKARYYYSAYQKNTRYDMFVRCQSRGKILMVALFFPKDLADGWIKPMYEIYCNIEGNEFLTYIQHKGQQGKWSTSKVGNLGKVFDGTWLNDYWCHDKKDIVSRIWQNPEGKNTIKSRCKTEERGILGIVEWENKAREQSILAAEERQQKPWDADMKLVPDILPGFKTWMQYEQVGEYFIFYDYDKNGAKTGYCSHCRQIVPLKDKPHHNEETKCPCCRKKARYKVKSRIQTLSTSTYYGTLIQRLQGGFVIREFYDRQYYRGRAPEDPETWLSESDRYIVINGVTKHYSWEYYKNKKMRWVLKKDAVDYPRWEGDKNDVYRKNLNSLLKTALKGSTIGMWKKLPISTAGYLYTEKQYPIIEKLVKVKLWKLAKEIIQNRWWMDKYYIDKKATELVKMLKIDKARLKRLKKMNGNSIMLNWMQLEKLANTIWPDDMFRFFGKHKLKSSDFGFLTPHTMSYVQCYHYLEKQAALTGETVNQTLYTWRDYINMADQLKRDISNELIYKPRNIAEAHSEMVLLSQQKGMEKQTKELEKKWPKVNEILPDLQKFAFEDDEYSIVVPESIYDIVKEGTALRHCIHTVDFYFDRIQKHESYIFFLRRSSQKEVPYYSLEVEPNGNIRQKRTLGDNQNADFKKAVGFLKKWQQYFKKKITQKEKKYGEAANQARIKEYAKLRQDQKKVWHGTLSGQLLADVLEADFMEAI